MAEPGITAFFRTHPIVNERLSIEKARPIFDEIEVCEIRFAGNRDNVGVFPAHDITTQMARADGSTQPVSYAERFADEYEAFTKGKQQTVSGTPLSEVPFLTEAKRAELRKLNIHNVETLATLDGAPLKTLGMDGRQYVDQAKAYLERAASSANDTRLAAENAQLRDEVERLRSLQSSAPKKTGGPDFEGMSEDDLKRFIKDKTGEAPRGNPSLASLVRMATDANKGG